MRIDYRYFPYLMTDVIVNLRAIYDPDRNNYPYFEYGTYLELVKQLEIKDKNQLESYPLVWLVWEANENNEKEIFDEMYSISPRVFIVSPTEPDYSSAERFTNNFEAILNPIFQEFIYQVQYHVNIDFAESNPFTKTDHLLWGESLGFAKDKNVLNCPVDAIEVKFNELLVCQRSN